MSDYISDQLRAEASRLRNSIAPPPRTFSWGPQISAQEIAEAKAERQAAAEQAQAEALAEWEQLRAKFTDTPQGNVLRDLLNVHQPELWTYSDRGPVCGYCDQIGGPEREGVAWPCVNYETIRDGIG